MRPHEARNILKVGLFLTFLIGILMVFILFIGKENNIFNSKISIKGRGSSAQNLKTGAFVQLKGLKVGKVSHINIISQEQVEVTASVSNEYAQWIKMDSKMEISNAGLVGDKFLAIVGGSESSKPADSSTVLEIAPPLSVDRFVNQGEDLAQSATLLVKKFNSILDSLNKNRSLESSISDFKMLVKNLKELTGKLNQGELETTLKQVSYSSKKVSTIMDRIEKGPGAAHSFLYDDILHEKMVNLLGGAERSQILKYFIRKSIKDAEEEQKPE